MRQVILFALLAAAVAGCGKSDPKPAGPGKPGDPTATAGPRVVEPRAKFSPNFPVKEKLKVSIPSALLLSADGTRAVVSAPEQADKKSQAWALDGEPRKLSEFDGTATFLFPDGKKALRQLKTAPNDYIDLATGQATPTKSLYAGPGWFFWGNDVLVAPTVSHVWDRPSAWELCPYDLKADKELDRVKVGKDDRTRYAAPVKQGRELVYALPREDLIRVWDMTDRKQLREFKLTGGQPLQPPINHMSWTNFRVSQPDGKWVAVSRNFGAPEIFSGETGALAAAVADHGWVWEFVPGRDLYLTCAYTLGRNGVPDLAAFDIKTKKFVAVFRGHESQIYRLSLSEDGKTMVTGHGDGSILVWDLGKLE